MLGAVAPGEAISAGKPDWSNHTLSVELTRSQVETSPPIETDKPVSRQYEEELSQHYAWPVYWPQYPAVPVGVAPLSKAEAARAVSKSEETLRAEGIEMSGDPHLRSVKEVSGYYIRASDGDIGHLADFIVDTDEWSVRYVVVDTRNWLPGRKRLPSSNLRPST